MKCHIKYQSQLEKKQLFYLLFTCCDLKTDRAGSRNVVNSIKQTLHLIQIISRPLIYPGKKILFCLLAGLSVNMSSVVQCSVVQCSVVQWNPSLGDRVLAGFSIAGFLRTDRPGLPHITARFSFSSFLVFQFSNFLVFLFSNILVFQFSSFLVFQFSSFLVFLFSILRKSGGERLILHSVTMRSRRSQKSEYHNFLTRVTEHHPH